MLQRASRGPLTSPSRPAPIVIRRGRGWSRPHGYPPTQSQGSGTGCCAPICAAQMAITRWLENCGLWGVAVVARASLEQQAGRLGWARCSAGSFLRTTRSLALPWPWRFNGEGAAGNRQFWRRVFAEKTHPALPSGSSAMLHLAETVCQSWQVTCAADVPPGPKARHRQHIQLGSRPTNSEVLGSGDEPLSSLSLHQRPAPGLTR
ncbi:hypothetical protein B0T14DRAFT_19170 [Immersiella caudata]|uniref:Uncharacterized protein n=1 Tax=Immersiella caudata TaxID=314043 RepID=A0AA39XDM2_9PEZI|nr:hypothetical protein B0T14DRAFT_19170 [Immersiella caudata]